MTFGKGVVLFVIVAAAGTVTAFWGSAVSLGIKRTFGVADVAADREIFEAGQPYNESMRRDLENIEIQYVQARPEEKDALRALALHRFSVYPQDRLTAEQRRFYLQLKAGAK